MTLKYREDDGLAVLALAEHADLEKLAQVLTFDSDGKKRYAQQLLDDPGFQKARKAGNLQPAWRSIAAELQAFGGDGIANQLRSAFKDHTGVPYREILADICKQLGLEVKADRGIKEVEDQMLMQLFRKVSKDLSAEETIRILQETAQGAGVADAVPGGSTLDELMARINADGRLAYLISIVTPGLASLALPFLARISLPAVAGVIAMRAGGALIPGVGALALLSTATLATGPALRVTLPAVLEVIRIRRAVLLSPLQKGRKA
jgi:uncharacterized protein YaaW (UPF0174 family)